MGNALDMTPEQKRVKQRARDSAEKAAYVAVGAPTAALKALNARVSDLRDTVRSSRKELSDDIATEIDEWIAEGEKVIERATERFRDSQVAEEIKSSARSTKRAARVGMDKATGAARTTLDGMAPDEELTVVNGVGPGYAERLGHAGIIGVTRFLERTDSRDDIEELAQSTGISEDTITSWRNQVDLGRISGVGASYQDLLHRVGVWTIDQLAEATPGDLVAEMESVGPDQVPNEDVVVRWKSEAGRLSS